MPDIPDNSKNTQKQEDVKREKQRRSQEEYAAGKGADKKRAPMYLKDIIVHPEDGEQIKKDKKKFRKKLLPILLMVIENEEGLSFKDDAALIVKRIYNDADKTFKADFLNSSGKPSSVQDDIRFTEALTKFLHPLTEENYRNALEQLVNKLSDKSLNVFLNNSKTSAERFASILRGAGFRKDALVVLFKRWGQLDHELKKYYLEKPYTVSIREENYILSSRFDELLDSAVKLTNAFRNVMVHTSAKTDPLESFTFNKFDGSLFKYLLLFAIDSYLSISQKIEEEGRGIEKYEAELKFWSEILNVGTSKLYNTEYWLSQGRIEGILEKLNSKAMMPLVFVFAALALFIEGKEFAQLLALVRFPNIPGLWAKQFSLRGGYKVITPGIMGDDKQLTLHVQQINQQDSILNLTLEDNRRKIYTYDDFLNEGVKAPPPSRPNEGSYYQRLLHYYNFSNSYPEIVIKNEKGEKISAFEDKIKTTMAESISKMRLDRRNNIRADNQKYRAAGQERNCKAEPKGPFEPEEIKGQLTKVFRRGDTFLREAMAFLESHDPYWFGGNWRIVGNAVIWYEPLTEMEFDLRRRTKPSRNAVSSLYKMRYNAKNEGKIISIGRTNLQALVASVILKNKVDFSALRETASDAPPVKKPPENNAPYSLEEDLFQKCQSWNDYQKFCFIIKFIRKFLPEHLHLDQSLMFHGEMREQLARYDYAAPEVRVYIEKQFTSRGIACPTEVKGILTADSLLGLCQKTCLVFNTVPSKQGQEKSAQPSPRMFTWKKGAFTPSLKADPSILKALGWKETQNGFLFDILYNHYETAGYKLPLILNMYKEEHKGKIYSKDIPEARHFNTNEAAIRFSLCEEMLFCLMAFYYLDKVQGGGGYIKFIPQRGQEKRSPVTFDMQWGLSPKIQLTLEEYHKKDIRNALFWFLDERRLGGKKSVKLMPALEGRNTLYTSQEKAQLCLSAVLNAYNFIKTHPVLKNKTPKIPKLQDGTTPNIPSTFEGNTPLKAIELKYIMDTLLWAQRELLYLVIRLEEEMYYILKDKKVLPNPRNGVYEFPNLIDKMRSVGLANMPLDLKHARIILAHGGVSTKGKDKEGYKYAMDYAKIIKSIDDGLAVLPIDKKTVHSIFEYYNRIKNIRH